jgi:formate dehydrogenase major subunit
MGVGALGLVNRGFDTVVKPTLENPLAESGCISCGQCVSVCPTGALQERLTLPKSVPLDTAGTDTTCPYCSVGCSLTLETYGDLLVKANPDKDGVVNKGLLCGKGKFGFDCAELEGKLTEPLIRAANGKSMDTADYYDAFVTAAKKAQSIGAKYGRDAVAFAVSDRYTNEEIYAIRRLAEVMGARVFSFNNRRNGLSRVLGAEASPNTMDEVIGTDYVLAVGFDPDLNPVMSLKLKQAAEAGAKVVYVLSRGTQVHAPYADEIVRTANNLKFLKEFAAAALASGAGSGIAGADALKRSLKDVKVSAGTQEIADGYLNAKKAMIVYQQNTLTPTPRRSSRTSPCCPGT